jgi:hypothetical protein
MSLQEAVRKVAAAPVTGAEIQAALKDPQNPLFIELQEAIKKKILLEKLATRFESERLTAQKIETAEREAEWQDAYSEQVRKQQDSLADYYAEQKGLAIKNLQRGKTSLTPMELLLTQYADLTLQLLTIQAQTGAVHAQIGVVQGQINTVQQQLINAQIDRLAAQKNLAQSTLAFEQQFTGDFILNPGLPTQQTVSLNEHNPHIPEEIKQRLRRDHQAGLQRLDEIGYTAPNAAITLVPGIAGYLKEQGVSESLYKHAGKLSTQLVFARHQWKKAEETYQDQDSLYKKYNTQKAKLDAELAALNNQVIVFMTQNGQVTIQIGQLAQAMAKMKSSEYRLGSAAKTSGIGLFKTPTPSKEKEIILGDKNNISSRVRG